MSELSFLALTATVMLALPQPRARDADPRFVLSSMTQRGALGERLSFQASAPSGALGGWRERAAGFAAIGEVELRDRAGRSEMAPPRRGTRWQARSRGRREPEPLVAPVRCVFDYLEAVAAAAPPRPRGAPSLSASRESESRWTRVRSYLAPRALDALDAAHSAQPLAPWSTLGRDGAFVGYELMAVRRAPRGAVVVAARERLERAAGAGLVSVACTYLVARVSGTWRIADKRCGRDFSNTEVEVNYRGYWDEPVEHEPHQPVDDWFGEGLE